MCDVCCGAAVLAQPIVPYAFRWSTRVRRGAKLANNPHAPPVSLSLPDAAAPDTAVLLVKADPDIEREHPLDPERGTGTVYFGFPSGGWTRGYTYGSRPLADFMDLAQAMSYAGVDATWDFLPPEVQAAILAKDAAQLEAAWDRAERAAHAWDAVSAFAVRSARARSTSGMARAVQATLTQLLQAPPDLQPALLAKFHAALTPARHRPADRQRLRKKESASLRRLRRLFARAAKKHTPPEEAP